ncbi:pentatricopeptide repeat-containing protein At4g19220, mitochondrial isoform X2 [Diospyros lotus]|uniref:pentatricopeptide repeat-containing protein At4g19220, mitochondrial isoform X2 n=1 Tax=Diospyros lotus TaxID=55363 RepID=UPI002253C1FC|nr:pentatricopeptide repeat-containing protein At4g19220, mitochondrial isoform X2 [Diospyros lotus]
MGCWTLEPKISLAIRVNPLISFLEGTASPFHQISPNKTSQFLLHSFPFRSHSNTLQRKRRNAWLFTPGPLLCLFTSAAISTAPQPFDKISLREQSLENRRFREVLDIINKLSSLKPDILSVRMVHSLVLKVGAFAHLPASTSLLIVYARSGDFQSAVALFGEILDKDVIVWNAMMTMYIENGCLGAAVDFFVAMVEEGPGFDSRTLVIAISALSNMNRLEQGQILHGLSVKTGMLSDSFLCNALIDMYAKCGELSSSECLFEAMQFKDLVSWNSMITGCVYNNNPQKSLQYFKRMASCERQADDVSLSCAIAAASTCFGEWITGQVIHGWGIKLGYDESSHISFANSIISLYSQCGYIEAAQTVFRGMIHKDVISWNSMVDGFASNGKIIEAFDLLCEMQLAGRQLDTVTVVTIVPLCAELMLLSEGRSIHGFAVRRYMGSDLSVVNSLMDMYMKCEKIKAAEQLFNTMPDRDLVSWNIVILGYSQNGQSGEAQTLFKELLYRYSHYSLSTLLAILPSCSSPEHFQFGKSIHCWQLKMGFSNYILAINSLIFMYINCGDLKASLSLFSRVSASADTSCWNTTIAGCTQNGYFEKALEYFNLMRRASNVRHDSITLVNVLSACGNLELVNEGKLLHGLSFKTLEGTEIRVQNALITMYGRLGEIESAKLVFYSSCKHNLCSWNCMISAFAQNKESKRALELFCSLEFEPNEITISTMLSACAELGLLRHGKQIHAYVLRFGFQKNTYISAALVDMYSNCGRMDLSQQMFHNLPEKSVAAWNSMISAYGFHNNGQKAIEIFDKMIESGTRPTKSTFVSLLSTCSHLGLLDEGLEDSMRLTNLSSRWQPGPNRASGVPC